MVRKRMCVCVCVYIYIYIHTYTHTRMRTRASVWEWFQLFSGEQKSIVNSARFGWLLPVTCADVRK